MFSMLNAQFITCLCSQLSWNKARIACLGVLLLSILRNRTVNLAKLTAEADASTTDDNLYRRFQRFFFKFAMPLDDIGRLVLSKLPKPSDGWVLSMDRTNWKYGKTHINILVVAVVINKVAIPIVWRVLPQATKRGNSNSEQRIGLMKRLLKLVPAGAIKVLTMDREFIGEKWLKWLDSQGVRYVVRIKSNTKVDGLNAASHTHRARLRSAQRKTVWGLSLYFSGCRITGKNTREDFLYVVSNFYHGSEALKFYKQRWGIEQLFSHLKKRGFDLETTHMEKDYKIEKLIGVLTLAFLIAYGWGREMTASGKLTATQKRKSVFRRGLDQIARMLSHRVDFEHQLNELLTWFESPKYRSIFVV